MGKYNNQYCKELAKRIFMDDLNEASYYPKYFTIETTNNCNASCIMCPKGQRGTKSLQLMSDALFDKIVEEIKAYNNWIEMICLNSDGEPLLDRKIAFKIKKLKDIGIKHVNISTNGALLSQEKIGELLDSGLDDIRISIDGYTEETYEKVRLGLSYRAVKENVLSLIRMRNETKNNMEIRIRMVELDENIDERDEWLRYWKSQVKENDRVQIMPMHTWSGKIAEEDKTRIEYYSDKPCVSVFSSCTINYDGIVQLCDSDIAQQQVMGDVNYQTIQEIWQSEQFETIREWHANAKRNNIAICQGCDHWSREFKEQVM